MKKFKLRERGWSFCEDATRVSRECMLCRGKGKLDVRPLGSNNSGVCISCRQCRGTGSVSDRGWVNKLIVFKTHIQAIDESIHHETVYFLFRPDIPYKQGKCISTPQSPDLNFFKTEEEARKAGQKWIDKRTKAEKRKEEKRSRECATQLNV